MTNCNHLHRVEFLHAQLSLFDAQTSAACAQRDSIQMYAHYLGHIPNLHIPTIQL